MNNKSLFIVLITFLVKLTSVQSYAQHNIDSLRKKTELHLPIYPRLKYLSVSHDQGGESDYKVENTGRPANEGKITRGRLQILANVPIWKEKGFTLSASEVFRREILQVTETINPLFSDQTKTYNFNHFLTTINGTYVSRLFNKSLISGASIIVESDNFIEPQKLTGLLTTMLIFQKNPNTRYTLGIAIIADPSAQIPAFPIIT